MNEKIVKLCENLCTSDLDIKNEMLEFYLMWNHSIINYVWLGVKSKGQKMNMLKIFKKFKTFEIIEIF
jgi:hypothetical protein